MKILSIILYPFSILYGIAVFIRNKLYDFSIFKTTVFSVPVINIGNINYGGTGKTPHVEYIVRLLHSAQTATLSRGYMRKTKGFILADENSTSLSIGDEPKQFKTKFPDIPVAVCENRCNGIKEILRLNPAVKCIILDDAFQHRAVKAGINILLTDYNKLFTKDCVLPSGTLREYRCGARRADIIVVTRCPQTLTEAEREELTKEINPAKHQQIYFSYLKYGNPVKFSDTNFDGNINHENSVLLFSGIANIKPFERYLREKYFSLTSVQFSDHHQYSLKDLQFIRKKFNTFAAGNKIIVTTEKDAMRIESPEQKEILNNLPVFYVPLFVEFFEKDKKMFNQKITDYVANA